MNTKYLIMALSLTGLISAGISPVLPKNIHRWVLEMHRAQIDLLKIKWGNPGFCTDWDRDYKSATSSCGNRGKLITRGSP